LVLLATFLKNPPYRQRQAKANEGQVSYTTSPPCAPPIDEDKISQMFNLSPSLSNRRSSNADLLPGLPDKTPRRKKDKSPLAKDPTKEGTVEVPGLVSLLEKSVGVDERHHSNHFGEPPLKAHLELELPSEFRGELG
jgi:hypothetical protein